MSGKRKIRFTAGLIALALITWAAWPEKKEDALTITYAGVSTNDTSLVVFTLTNRSRNTIGYLSHVEIRAHGRFVPSGEPFFLDKSDIGAQSAETTGCIAVPGKPWRIAIAYSPLGKQPLVLRMRQKVAVFTYDHRWPRLTQWIQPSFNDRTAYGPEMLGQKPLANGEK